MQTAQHKLKIKLDRLYKQRIHARELLNKLAHKKATPAIIRVRKAHSNSIMRTNKKINNLKVNMQKNKTNRNKRESLKNMKNNKEFSSHSATLMPKNPSTEHSYVLLFVKNQSNPTSPQISSKPVEHGMNMSTTTQMGANTIPIDAVIGGMNIKDMREVRREVQKLKYWSNNGTPLVYHSKDINSESVQISDFTPAFDYMDGGTGLNSANISLTLNETKFFESNVKKKKGSKKHVGHKGAKKGSKNKKGGTKHHYVIAKAGYTYLHVARIKNTSLSHVESLNSYPASKIPMGARIYY